jgi:hypothetical protein
MPVRTAGFAGLAAAALIVVAVCPAQDADDVHPRLQAAVARYFAADAPADAALRDALALAKGRDDLLAAIVTAKSFVAKQGAIARRGTIDANGRFRDLPPAPDPDSSPAGAKPADAENAALFFGPEAGAGLCPLVVYVPDDTRTGPYERELEAEGARRGRFVFLVPDEKRDNRWNPTQHERKRHVGPLRDFLLSYPIDPDRVFLAGTGRGGHATWDVGLTYAERWAGLVPCNGGLIHEGGYKASGGVFLQNAKSLVIHSVFNTSFDHGIEGCRYAAAKFKEWGYRSDSVEEPKFRNMGLREAMERLGEAARDPHPREIVKRFNHLDAADHYWLRALDRVPHEWDPASRIAIRGKLPDEPLKQREAIWEQVKEECAFLQGSVRDNRIDVTVKGVGRLRIWFDPAIVDFKAKVTVAINGKPRPPFAVEKKAETMLRHVHETGDTSRLYWAYKDFAVAD